LPDGEKTPAAKIHKKPQRGCRPQKDTGKHKKNTKKEEMLNLFGQPGGCPYKMFNCKNVNYRIFRLSVFRKKRIENPHNL
jgi:hypothetical protein